MHSDQKRRQRARRATAAQVLVFKRPAALALVVEEGLFPGRSCRCRLVSQKELGVTLGVTLGLEIVELTVASLICGPLRFCWMISEGADFFGEGGSSVCDVFAGFLTQMLHIFPGSVLVQDLAAKVADSSR